jgi:hypothetical protein
MPFRAFNINRILGKKVIIQASYSKIALAGGQRRILRNRAILVKLKHALPWDSAGMTARVNSIKL